MRKRWGVTALVAGLALLFSAGAMPAYADPGNGKGNGQANGQAGDPAGANGTVKIHDWPEHKNGSDMANDPKVCQFELHGFGFDAAQTGRWWVQEHKWGNGDPSKAVLTGGYTANGSGDWTSGPHQLDDGHYKLFVEMTHAAGNSGNTVTTYKMKVFKVECPVSGGTTTGGTTDTTGGTQGGGTVGGSESSTTGGQTTQTTAGGTTTTEGATTGGASSTTAVAGFQSMPAGGLDHMQPGAVAGSQSGAVAGSQSAAAELAAIASLPATSTAPDASLGIIGLVLTTLGAALLRRIEKDR